MCVCVWLDCIHTYARMLLTVIHVIIKKFIGIVDQPPVNCNDIATKCEAKRALTDHLERCSLLFVVLSFHCGSATDETLTCHTKRTISKCTWMSVSTSTQHIDCASNPFFRLIYLWIGATPYATAALGCCKHLQRNVCSSAFDWKDSPSKEWQWFDRKTFSSGPAVVPQLCKTPLKPVPMVRKSARTSVHEYMTKENKLTVDLISIPVACGKSALMTSNAAEPRCSTKYSLAAFLPHQPTHISLRDIQIGVPVFCNIAITRVQGAAKVQRQSPSVAVLLVKEGVRRYLIMVSKAYCAPASNYEQLRIHYQGLYTCISAHTWSTYYQLS